MAKSHALIRTLRSGGSGAALWRGLFGALARCAEGQFAEEAQDYGECQGGSDDYADAVEKGLTAGFTAQGFGGLGLDFELKGLDPRLLIGDLFLLIGDLFLEASCDRILPLLLLTLG